MAAPVYDSAGAGVATTTINGNHSQSCPATVNAGDFLLLHCAVTAGTNTTAATFSMVTSGWTAFAGNSYGSTDKVKHALFWKVADGSEDGASITVDVANGAGTFNLYTGRIYRYTHADGHDSNSVEGIAHNEGTDNSHEPPTLTPGGSDRLAVLVGATGKDLGSGGDIVGESGGTWVLRENFFDTGGQDGDLIMYTADQSGGAAISGGAASYGGSAENWSMVGFLLKPAVSGNQEATPSPVTIPLVIPAPTVTNVYTVTPDPVTVPLVIPDPTVSLTYTVAPDPVVITLVLPAPSLTAGAITATPDPVVLVLALPEPSVASGIFATPDPVVITLVLPDITFSYSQVAAPDPVSVTLVIPSPTLTAGAIGATPDPVSVVLTLPVPAFVGDPAGAGAGLTYVRQISFGIIPF